MSDHDVVIAIFGDHREADVAVRKLIEDGFDMKKFSVVGKGYHTEEKIVGFFNMGDRMKLWGKYGAFWGGLWGFFFGGVFLAIPMLGSIVVLGYMASVVVSMIEGALIVGSLTAVGAAIASVGIPKDSVIKYETAVKANGFLVMGHGSADEMVRAKSILGTFHPAQLDLHEDVKVPTTPDQTAPTIS